MTRYYALDLRCRDCGAPPGQSCRSRVTGWELRSPHPRRRYDAATMTAATGRPRRRPGWRPWPDEEPNR